MNVVIVDYGSGNIRSAEKAFERAALDAGIEADVAVTAWPDRIAAADRLVLPGVGAFADCYEGLAVVPGLIDALEEAVRRRGVPFLGICVGMQLLATRGLENRICRGLGWIPGDVTRLEPHEGEGEEAQGHVATGHYKIPHMGWNTLESARPHPITEGIPFGSAGWHAYFVHSYAFRPRSEEATIALTDYGGAFASIVGSENVVGTQFHPEKSQALGQKLIGNFLRWSP